MQGNRILSMTLRNIKNVKYGHFEFPECASYEKGLFTGPKNGVLGLYGQNGSGKTTIVSIFSIIKSLAMRWNLADMIDNRKRVNNELAYLLSLDEDYGSVVFECLIENENKNYKVAYELGFSRGEDGQTNIAKESLCVYPFHNKGTPFKYPFAPIIIDYTKPYLGALYDGIRHEEGTAVRLPSPGSDEYKIYVQLSAQKELCRTTESSLLFSAVLNEYLKDNNNEDVREVGAVLEEFRNQASFNLFVFSSRDAASVHFNQSLVSGVYRDIKNGREIHGMFLLEDKPFPIRKEHLGAYEETIANVNSFISTFVPGFKLEIDCKSTETDQEGNEKIKIEICRTMGKSRLPLSQESAGIKRLVNLCGALSFAYGDQSAWVVVDEMDSGVFENLWGQIIELLSEEGRGQIIFTAHNLAPLERIPVNSLVFTTQNPSNKYVRFKNVKKTNNLRDLYLRALRLGGQEEVLANEVDEQDLGIAFAGAYENLVKRRKPDA